jgi:hypothetical protein
MLDSKGFAGICCHKLTNEGAPGDGRAATLKGNRMKAAIIDHTVNFIERKERDERVIQTAGLTNDTTSSVVGR